MNGRAADIAVGFVAAALLLGGGLLAWQAAWAGRIHGRMMGSMMGGGTAGPYGAAPLWYAVGGLVAAAVVVGAYALVRSDLAWPTTGPASDTSLTSENAPPADADTRSNPGEGAAAIASADTETGDGGTAAVIPSAIAARRLLDLLPEDERRVLEPVVESPGLTQIAIRDRADFSKSKVSQTVTDLEKRGLLYRERQGRTYRVYPADDLRDGSE